MPKPRLVGAAIVALALALCGLPGSATPRAGAQQQHVIRIATLAPRGTPLVRMFQEWDRLLQAETSGQVRFQILAGGVAGDELDVVRKMRAGQVDAAALTTTGLGAISRPVMVLGAPGLISDYAQLDRVRSTLATEFDGLFAQAGYKLLGWGDAGRIRMFSNRRIARPADLRAARPWVWRDNPVMVEFIRSAGANGVPLGVPEVYPALQTGMTDTVLASALTAVGLQWFSRVQYVSAQASGVIIGALVIKQDRLDALPANARDFILRTSSEATSNEAMRTGGRVLDDRAYRALIGRGLEAVDTEAHRAEWEEVGRQTRERLVGRVYSAELLRRVEAAAR